MFGYIVMLYNIRKTIAAAPKEVAAETIKAPKLVQVTAANRGEELGQKIHSKLEGLPAIFTTLSIIAILVGTLIEFVPMIMGHEFVPSSDSIRPYRPLELAGRDIYVREGCYTCHSQMIRSLDFDVLRYGKATTAEESQWDHPFQWGSKRIGPDLARVGTKYPDLWHYRHMIDPRSMTPQSIMPTYAWLARDKTNYSILPRKLAVLKQLGTPYSDDEVQTAEANARSQADEIAKGLISQGAPTNVGDYEIVALIAYLQRLGQGAVGGGK